MPNASVQIWQTDDHGTYDLQLNDPSVMDMRGWFHTDPQGRYCLLAGVLDSDGRSGGRYDSSAETARVSSRAHSFPGGCRELVTALYLRNDDHIDSDTVFGVTESLVTETRLNDPSSHFPELPSIQFDFTLATATAEDASGRVGADPSQIVKGQTVVSH